MTRLREIIRETAPDRHGVNGRYPHERHVVVNHSLCLHCGTCVAICPPDVLFLHNGSLTIDDRTCTCCERCMKVCPVHALSMVEMPS